MLWLLLVACSDSGLDIEKGVSRQLAVERKSMIGHVDYTLFFEIPAQKEQPVVGESQVSFVLLKEDVPVVFDFKAGKNQLLAVESNGERVSYIFKNEHVIIPARFLKKGQNHLSFRFIAGDSPLNRQDDFLYTLLVPDRSRFLMPCFDQPDLKASYTLRLKVPAGWVGISNGELLRVESFATHTLYEFDKTRPISTYLFSFVAGRFNYTREYSYGRWIDIYHRETDSVKIAQSVPAITEQVTISLNWMRRYTGQEYPFGPYRVVAIPDFQFGGMEHPGATYYRSSLLFLGPEADQTAHIRRSELIAHETAHMWFGNLVTMKWFDDVWLKEVFAGLMADKILASLYPNMNYRFNFFINHFEPSLRTDRTQGTHPILQTLDNLKDAGTLYGDIIYHKAPIVMRMLEEQIPPYLFRQSLINYLAGWRYSNADWNDLLQEIQRTTGRELSEWNTAWLKEAGAPLIELTTEGILMTDPQGKDRIWPQWVSMYRQGPGWPRVFSLTDSLTPYPGMDGVCIPDPEVRGYGMFLPTEKGIKYLYENLNRLSDPLYRAVAWQSLYNGVLEKKLKAESFVRMCIRHLSQETDNQIITRGLSFLTTVYSTYLDEGGRQLLRDDLERFYITILFKNQPELNKKPFFRSLMSVYASEDTGNYFHKVLTGAIAREDLPVTDEDRLAMAFNLTLRHPEQYERMLGRYIRRIVKNPDMLKRFEFVYPAVSGDKEVRDSLFQALLQPENRVNEVWVAEALRWLNHPIRRMEAEEYIPRMLGALQEIQETGDIFFPSEWLRAGLSSHTGKYAWTTVCQFLEKNPHYPENLKKKILTHTDHLRRLHAE